MVGAKCIQEVYSTMQDNCYTYMHALHYSYGMMQYINKALPVHRHRELAPLFGHYPTPPPLPPCSLSLHYPHYTLALPTTPPVLSPSYCPITSSTHLFRPQCPYDRHTRHDEDLQHHFLSQP